MEKEFNEKVEKIKEAVGPTSLYISRVPRDTKTRFKELAKDEFMDDFGMLLKKLVEIYDGFYPTGNEEIEAKIDYIANEVSLLKTKLMELEKEPKTERRVVKMVDGKIRIGRKKNE